MEACCIESERHSGVGAEMADYHGADYYRIIGVGRDATATQIRAAYRAKARMCHPDVCRDPNAAHVFTQLVEAYGVLSDAGKRRDYDAFLDREHALPGIPVRFGFDLRPIVDRATRWLPEDPLPFLTRALQLTGLSLAALILFLAVLYVL